MSHVQVELNIIIQNVKKKKKIDAEHLKHGINDLILSITERRWNEIYNVVTKKDTDMTKCQKKLQLKNANWRFCMDKYIIMLIILGSTRLEAYHRLKVKNDAFKKTLIKRFKNSK